MLIKICGVEIAIFNLQYGWFIREVTADCGCRRERIVFVGWERADHL